MDDALISIFICVVLPVAIVFIRSYGRINGDNKRTQIILKALEANKDVDTDKLIESFKKTPQSARQILNLRLLRGCIFSLVGIVLVTVGVVNLICGAGFSADPVSVPMLFGGASMAIGVSYLIVYWVTRKDVDVSEQ